jgi:hypothetical protein
MFKFLKAARNLVNQGMSKEAIEQFARNEFGEINELFQKQIDNLFKKKEGIENIKIKDEVFDDTVIKLPIDDTGKPFNPKDPLKEYGKPKKDEGIMSQYKTIDDEVTQAEKDAFLDNFLANADRTYANFVTKAMKDIQKASKLEQEQMIKAISERSGMFRHLDDADADKIIKSADTSKPRDKKYTGGMVDVEPSLSDIGHGSDALMARTRLMSPGAQATTSTGLNYLLAEDNDNIRVPFAGGKSFSESELLEFNKAIKEKIKKGGRSNMPVIDPEEYKKYLESFKTTKAAEGGRIGFSKGKLADIARRKFMKAAGAGVAGLAALKTGLLGFGKQATKEVAKEVITTPAAAGKPPWFDALVTRVIREGDDVTKTMATKDRQNVYRTKIDDETEIMVTQDLDEGVTRIDIDDSVRNVTGFDDPPTVSLQVTDEIVEEGGARIKPEFKATENDYRNYATDPDGGYETEFVENTVDEVKNLTSDLTKVKSFATKKGPTMEEIVISKKKRDDVKYANENPSSYAADRGPDYDPSDYIDDMADDYASGGIARMIGE